MVPPKKQAKNTTHQLIGYADDDDDDGTGFRTMVLLLQAALAGAAGAAGAFGGKLNDCPLLLIGLMGESAENCALSGDTITIAGHSGRAVAAVTDCSVGRGFSGGGGLAGIGMYSGENVGTGGISPSACAVSTSPRARGGGEGSGYFRSCCPWWSSTAGARRPATRWTPAFRRCAPWRAAAAAAGRSDMRPRQ